VGEWESRRIGSTESLSPLLPFSLPKGAQFLLNLRTNALKLQEVWGRHTFATFFLG
jgi:hypothetical protein